MRLSRSLHQFRAQICHKPWQAKSLRLAVAYTSYGAADKILRRLTAYEVYGGLRWLTAAARGSSEKYLEKSGIWRGLRVPTFLVFTVVLELYCSYATQEPIPWRPQTMTATAMKMWKTNGVLLRNRQIHDMLDKFRQVTFWLLWFVVAIVEPLTQLTLTTETQLCKELSRHCRIDCVKWGVQSTTSWSFIQHAVCMRCHHVDHSPVMYNLVSVIAVQQLCWPSQPFCFLRLFRCFSFATWFPRSISIILCHICDGDPYL